MTIAQGFAAGSAGFGFDPVRAIGAGAQIGLDRRRMALEEQLQPYRITSLQQQQRIAGAQLGLDRRRMALEEQLQPYRVTSLQQEQKIAEFNLKRADKRAEIEDAFLEMMQHELDAQKAAYLDALDNELRQARLDDIVLPDTGVLNRINPDMMLTPSTPWTDLDALSVSAPTFDTPSGEMNSLSDEIDSLSDRLTGGLPHSDPFYLPDSIGELEERVRTMLSEGAGKDDILPLLLKMREIRERESMQVEMRDLIRQREELRPEGAFSDLFPIRGP